MFYRPENGHGLPHNPWNAIVAPRPIGWISTRGSEGDNLAPYSFFNALSYVPPQVMFSSNGSKNDREGMKDSLAQIVETRVFCVNIATAAQLEKLNPTTVPHPAGVSEFDIIDETPVACETIDCPRLETAAASLECRATQIIRLAGEDCHMVIGVVTGIHLRDDCVVDGRFDLSREGWIARMGYRDYARVHETFELERPKS